MVAQLDSLYLRTSPRRALIRLLSYTFFEGRPLTTKGRWINPLVFAFFDFQKHLPKLKTVKKPIFIIGTGRSGTTILGTLLSMHKEVGFLNEPKALWHSIYEQEDLAGSYSRGKAEYRLTENSATEEVKLAAQKLFGAYLTISGSKRVVDKYPELVFRIPFVRALFPDAKFIFLIRNGWDTCQSIEGWSNRLGIEVDAEVHDWWGVDQRKWKLLWEQIIRIDDDYRNLHLEREQLENPLDMATLEWIVTMREGLHYMTQIPHGIHLLRYEDLVSQPQHTLKHLLEFCELSPDSRFLEFALKKLSPVPARATYTMHPSLQPYFHETMNALGYTP
ncbi:sulfotransferase [Acaryochloris sp. IP29b_bin.148]|uniref:sulfotransferase family protein n=1 Tax=Acaryochloris sp. IP29b_bin.148 TaxID=2969218 RepID=UPI0026167396|nr:sulfotransferase [Acaryochloris sp. IP29b_bin.148]